MNYLLALLLGAVYCLGFAPFGLWPAVLVALGGLYWLLGQQQLRPWLVAWCFGVGKYGVGASWVYVSIHVYGQAPVPLALFLVALFVGFVALVFVLPLGVVWERLRGQSTRFGGILVFAGAWWLMDWLLTWFLTGFPWLFPGHAILDTRIGGLVPVTGTLALSFLIPLAAAAVVVAATSQRRGVRLCAVAIALTPFVAGSLAGTADWVDEQSRHSVALVQGNLDQARKWLPEERGPNVRKHLALSADHWDADLLIWPEAAITLFPDQAQRFLEDIAEQANATDTSFVTGIPGYEIAGEDYLFYNLAMGLGQARGRFAKHHLVPFGEYVPLEDQLRGLIRFFDLPMSSTSAGRANQTLLTTPMGPLAMAICYEVAYAESMRRQATQAAVLVTISNDTWFGRSIGPHQHMQIARARALENGRWLLRATNNGVTAVVDHLGQVRAQLPQFEAGVLRSTFGVMQGQTPYNRAGDWPGLVLALAGLALGAWRGRQTPVVAPE